jgi:hypothetical protein
MPPGSGFWADVHHQNQVARADLANCREPRREKKMAKIRFTLKNIDREIRNAQKKLRSIRGKVIKSDQKRIDLNLSALKKVHSITAHQCRPTQNFGQTFTSKPK